jgi:hypothetical protein
MVGRSKIVRVNDKMQRGYRHALTAPIGAISIPNRCSGRDQWQWDNAMRKMVICAVVWVFTPTLVWADSATVESGAKSEIATHTRYDSRCQPRPVRIRITAAPTNGTVTTETKTIVVPAKSDRGVPQQSPCVGKTMEGVVIYYQSEPGFVGQDSFRYQRLNPRDGGDPFNMEISYTITVK